MISIVRLFESMRMFKTKFPTGPFKFKNINKIKRKFIKVQKFDKGVKPNG